jgi:hypothetical protein
MFGFHFFSQTEELSVDVAPATLAKSGPNGELISNTGTATPTGGKPPYSYAWTRVSGDVFTINSPGINNTTFTGNGADVVKGGTYRCTVTDDNLDTAFDNVNVNFTFGTPV